LSRHAKAPQPKLKASRDSKPIAEGKISVSFRYLSQNKQRNFEFFSQKDFRGKAVAFEQLLEFLQRLTAKTQLEISPLSKDDDCGFEQMPFAQMNCNPDGIALGKDTKICVFRFGSGGN